MQNINLSMTPYTQAGVFLCSQYDVGREGQIDLVNLNGAYTIPTGATVTLHATKPSGLGFTVACTWSGSTVSFSTTATMTAEYGRFPAEIRIEKDDTILGSANFFIKVEKSPHPDDVIDGDTIIQKNLVVRVTTLETEVTALKSDLNSLIVENTEAISLNIQTGAYPSTTKEYWYNTGYRCAVIEVDDTDVIHVSSKSYTNVPIALFYSGVPSASNYLGFYGSNTEEIVYTNELLTIPSGTTHIVLNCRDFSNTFSATKTTKKVNPNIITKKISADYNGGDITLRVRYSATSDVVFVLSKKGGNGLFDFKTITEVFDDGTEKVLLTNVTDFFSPYMIRAVANVDGDLPDGWYAHFVGGNHQYNNGASGSTATARGTIDAVLFDGEAVTNSSKTCDKVDIYWTNYVQGQNTKKADGTGREILTEKYHLSYDGEEFKVDHVFTPSENISIRRYYGLSVFWYNASGYYYQFVGGTNRDKKTAPISFNSGDKTCREFIITDADNNKITAKMFDDDIGDWSMDNEAYSVFSTTDRKVYFAPIYLTDWATISSGTSYFYKASLKFEKLY